MINPLTKQEREELESFGSQELIVSSESKETAEKDIKLLKISQKYRRMIMKGTMPKSKKREVSALHDDLPARAAFNVVCALIEAGYNYVTIRSVYLNEHLFCFYGLYDKTEDDLKKDVLYAKSLIRKRPDTIQKKATAYIKGRSLKRETEVREICSYILDDLLCGNKPAGKGFYDNEWKTPFFFSSEEKMLMDVESDEFYFYARDRYGIPKKDYEPEVRDTIRAHIQRYESRIKSHTFVYFDKHTHKLYVSDHDNGIYLLDGKEIKHVDNGTDGVYFEFHSDFTPFSVDLGNLKAINYFQYETSEGLGLDYVAFKEENTLLHRYLIDITSFAETEKNLTVENQKFLLLVYFYSLFFESLMTEKPVICFIGLKDSGKSTIGTLIGKILFGEASRCHHFPETVRDLETVMGENYFIIFDNVDQYIRPEMLNSLCVTATGGIIEKRKLHANRITVKIRPHVFFGLTSRVARFKRDDFVSRLLLFNTKKITRRIQPEKFHRDIEQARDAIWEELLVNLNSIIHLLRSQRNYSPPCVFRVADWETFVRKICVGYPWEEYYNNIAEKMNIEKDKFTLEDDPLYILLENRVIVDNNYIEDKSASELFEILGKDAEGQRMYILFHKWYKSPISMGKRIKNVKDELRRVFVVETRPGGHNITLYSFRPLGEKREENPLKEKINKIKTEHQQESENKKNSGNGQNSEKSNFLKKTHPREG